MDEWSLNGTRSEMVNKTLAVLRKRVLSGELAAGGALAENKLAQEQGISRGTLRTALQILEGEGLIRTLPNGRREAKSFTRHDVQELYALRIDLESRAWRMIREKPVVDYAPLATILGEIGRMSQQEAPEAAWLRADIAFHRGVISLADSWAMVRCWDAIAPAMYAMLSINEMRTTNADGCYRAVYEGEFYEKHRQIYEGIVAGRPELEQMLSAHIRDAMEISLEMVGDRT